MSIITLTTDFGVGSPYVAAMKGVILSIDPAATIAEWLDAGSWSQESAGATVALWLDLKDEEEATP